MKTPTTGKSTKNDSGSPVQNKGIKLPPSFCCTSFWSRAKEHSKNTAHQFYSYLLGYRRRNHLLKSTLLRFAGTQSAFEILNERVKAVHEEQQQIQEQAKEEKPARIGKAEKSTFEQVISSPVTKQIGKELVRGVFGMLFGTAPKRSTAKRRW